MTPRRSTPRRRAPRRPRLEQPRWLIVPIAVTLTGLAVLISLATPREHLLGTVLAYVNLVIVGAAAVHFVQQRTLQGLIPVLFLVWFAAGWLLPTIYFATLYPEAVYYPMGDNRNMLFGAAWVQTVAFVFLATYLGTFLFFQGRHAPWTFSEVNKRTERRMGVMVLWIVTAAITLHGVSQVVALPAPLVYIASGSYNYLHGLMLMVGVLFLRLPMQTRLRALLFLFMAGAFYLLGNARGLAVLPATLFVVGLIFLSEVEQRYKTWTVIAACAALPIALVIGNTTRVLLGSIGFEDIGARLNALGQWQEVLKRTPMLAATFSRLFFVGGHSIIAYTPEYFPYVKFTWSRYAYEFFTRLLPGKLFFEPFYSSNERLQLYGFLITEETSYPMSLLGSLYLLGGVVPVGLGALAMALFHCGLARIIGAVRRRSPYLGLFIFSMIASTLIWSQNVDLITNVRVTAWRVLTAFVLYVIILRPFAELPAARRPTRRRVPPRRRPYPADQRFAPPALAPAAAPRPDLSWTSRA